MRHAPLRALPLALVLAACHGSTEPVAGGPSADAGLDAGAPQLPSPTPTPVLRDGDASDDPDQRAPRDAALVELDAGALDAGALDAGDLDAGDAELHDAATPPAWPRGDGGCVATPASDLDVLFMIDDSGSMAEEQAKLAKKLTRLVQVLTTGDKEAGKPTPSADEYPGRRFPPPASVRFGVVTSSLGRPPGVSNPAGATMCTETVGDGLLIGSGATAAVDQIDQVTQQVVVPARPECAAVDLTPPYVGFGAGERHARPDDAAELARGLTEFSCIAGRGLGGCGIEQSLESAYKALAPSSASDFVGPTTHGQGARNGLLRPDSLLAVVMVSDEDDCSVPAAGTIMFEQGDVDGYSVGVRCQMLAELPEYAGTIQPVQRYVDGLLALRAGRPERVVFAGIVGLPRTGVDYGDFAALLDRADMRAQLDPADRTSLLSVCGTQAVVDGGTSGGYAYPGRRFVKVAQGIAAAGGSAVLRSICDDDYAPVIDALVDEIAAGLTGC